MKIAKVIRGKKGRAGSSVNAVVAVNVEENGSGTVARSLQDVRIVQHDGHTEVQENDTDHEVE